MLLMLALATTATPLSAASMPVQARVGGQVLQAARVVGGLSDRPSGRGTTIVRNADGSRQTMPLVEFN